MESNILTDIFLPLALFIIMLGMGLSLVPEDFKRVVLYPKAAIVGLVNQMLFLPIIAFALCTVFKLPGELSVGMMILSACPGGATSNLITHLAKGDIALSISLTAISSFITVLTIPIIINFSLIHFMAEGQNIQLPVLKTIIQVVGITILPVSIGMIIKNYKSELSDKVEKPLKIVSAVFLFIIIVGAILKNKKDIVDFFIQAGPVALLLNVATLLLGYVTSIIFGLSLPQRRTVSIESGIQNGTLAIAIAASILKNPQMSIPPAIYSLIMFFTAGILIFSVSGKKGEEAK
jgi:bile acid:Na+ symporter, BASS family